MTFQEAEKTYKDIRSQHASGKLSDADFEAQVNQLKVQDAQSRWWQLGVRTGEWYVNDGQKWVKGKPPSTSQPPAAVPTAPPEDQEPPQVEKAERPSVLPRGLFSPKPEQHNGGGLPRPVLIGIIAVVALIVVGLIVGGLFLFGGSLFGGATARATTTPPQVIAILPTLAPSATPTVTDTPVISPTLVVSATSTVANPPSPARPTGPTATRRPNTPTSTPPKAGGPTATPAVPAGVYVTKVALDTAAPEPNVKIGFRVTFFNNSGGSAHKDKWQIVIFQINNQDKSFGDTALKSIDIPTGTSEVHLTDAWQVGPSGQPDCNYLAGAYYIDDNSIRQPFLNTDGKQFRLPFSVCK